MGDPAYQKYDSEDDDSHSSPLERAEKRWGMDENSDQDDTPSEHSSAREKANKRWGMDPDELSEAENDAGVADNNQTDEPFAPENSLYSGPSTKPKLQVWGSRRKKIGIGFAGVTIGSTMLGFLIFAPILKLEGYFSRINQKAFGYAASAVEARVQRLFEKYLVNHVLSLESCGNHITVDCASKSTGVASGLFNTWRDARIEEKMFDDFGIKVETELNPDPSQGKYKVTLRDRNDRLIKLSDGQLKSGQFTGGDRQFGKEINKFLKRETEWYEVMQRKSVRKYLTRKHGTNFWCFFACKTKDNVDLKILSAKTRMKYKFAERFVYPFSAKYGFVLDCIISGTPGSGKCSTDNLRKTNAHTIKLTEKAAKNIVDELKAKPDLKIGEFVINKLVQLIFEKELPQAALKSIPIAGQIYLVASIADSVDKMDTFIQNNGFSKFAADINSTQYIEYYQAMRSANDELKTGNLSMDEVGTLVGEFEGAEQSLVYQNDNAPVSKAITLFHQTAFAQTDDGYKCANDKPIPADQLVCNEKKVTRSYLIQDYRNDKVISFIHKWTDIYDLCTPVPFEIYGNCAPLSFRPKTVIRPILQAIDFTTDTVFGPIVDGLMSAAKALPGFSTVISFVEEIIGSIVKFFFGKVFPLPISVDSPGREKYDGLDAGAQLVASGFAQGGGDSASDTYGLGAVPLTPVQASAIRQQRYEQDEFNNSGIFDRIANLDNPRSLASNVIMSTPSSKGQAFEGFKSSLTSSFANLLNIFGILGTRTSAIGFEDLAHGRSGVDNPFGITVYGYPSDSPVFAENPDRYTDQYCAETKKAREDSKTEDPINGFEEFSVADPCMLEKAAVEAAGAYFTNE